MSAKATDGGGPSRCASDLLSTLSGGLLQSACKANRKAVAELRVYLVLALNPIAIRSTPSHLHKDLRVASNLYPDTAMPYRMRLNTEPENAGNINVIPCNALLRNRRDYPQHRPVQYLTISESVRKERCNARPTEIYNAIQN